jgi:hypothetical protein
MGCYVTAGHMVKILNTAVTAMNGNTATNPACMVDGPAKLVITPEVRQGKSRTRNPIHA